MPSTSPDTERFASAVASPSSPASDTPAFCTSHRRAPIVAATSAGKARRSGGAIGVPNVRGGSGRSAMRSRFRAARARGGIGGGRRVAAQGGQGLGDLEVEHVVGVDQLTPLDQPPAHLLGDAPHRGHREGHRGGLVALPQRRGLLGQRDPAAASRVCHPRRPRCARRPPLAWRCGPAAARPVDAPPGLRLQRRQHPVRSFSDRRVGHLVADGTATPGAEVVVEGLGHRFVDGPHVVERRRGARAGRGHRRRRRRRRSPAGPRPARWWCRTGR